MWAEKLYDGSFEGLSPYKFAFLKETDFREKSWHPCRATVNRARYCASDRVQPVSGTQAQRISVNGGQRMHGPEKLALAGRHRRRKERPADFSIFLRQSGIKGPSKKSPPAPRESRLASATFEPG